MCGIKLISLWAYAFSSKQSFNSTIQLTIFGSSRPLATQDLNLGLKVPILGPLHVFTFYIPIANKRFYT